MNLVIDAGNTSVKLGWFDGDVLVRQRVMPVGADPVLPVPENTDEIENALLAAVRDTPEDWLNTLTKRARLFIYGPTLLLPIINRYQSPSTLGSDRMANACGAFKLFPSQNVLVIDAGTCLKFDFVAEDGAYVGGSISPGLTMRYESLHRGTGRLPLLQPAASAPLTGNDTESSIHSGVINGMCAEIEGILDAYRKSYPDMKVLMTGGDAPFFLNRLKTSIFAAPSITLQGLNAILLQNVDSNA